MGFLRNKKLSGACIAGLATITLLLFQNCGGMNPHDASSVLATLNFNSITNVNISAGYRHTCDISSTNTARCWGDNSSGELGTGSLASYHVPVGVVTLQNVAAVATSPYVDAYYYYSCALITDGTVQCWGVNVGDFATTHSISLSEVPVAISSVTNAVQLAAGTTYACVLLNSGQVSCWGNMTVAPNGIDSQTPALVPGLDHVKQISSGTDFICVVIDTGAVKCWGQNDLGQLGNGETIGVINPASPQDVQNLMDVKQVSAGGNDACALLNSGTVKCWGYNLDGEIGNGQVGDGSDASNIRTPQDVINLANVTQVASGESHTCALLASGNIKCWGIGTHGELGNGAMVNSSSPVDVSGINNAIQISSGAGYSCAKLSDASTKCWGSNTNGQLGNNTTTNSSVPVTVVFLSTL